MLRGRRRDETSRLLAEGYDFLTNRTRGLGRRWFETRLMGRPAVLIGGGDAPEALYVPGRFTRVGALPPTALRLLQGKRSVNQLDGADHRARKAEFLGLLGPAAQAVLADGLRRALRVRLRPGRIVLLDAAESALCEAACAWAGVPAMDARTLARRTREFSAMVGYAGAAGPELISALALRRRNEAWARRLIRRARRGAPEVPPGSVLARVAAWKSRGRLLPAQVAAIELINLLRPTVAVARYVVFAADALRLHPAWRGRVLEDDAAAEAFALEVRRVYPFFPAVGGRVLQPFHWSGRRFRRGEWVLADLHGADHDPDRWTDPDRFDPDRFLRGAEPAAKVTAQGAGDPHLGHRCPGEGATIALIHAAARELAGVDWRLPPQDLRIPLWRLPTGPVSGMVLDVGPSSAPLPPSGAGRRGQRVAATGLAAALFGMGLLFLAAPRQASRVFGLPREGPGHPYVRALSFRDISFAAALALAARSRRSLAATAAAFALVPAADLALVLHRRGRRALPSAALHLLSGLGLAGLALACSRRPPDERPRGGRYFRRAPGRG